MANSNEYMNNYMKKRYKERRELALEIIGNTCVKCENTVNIEIDHKYWSDKTFNFSKQWNCSMKQFLKELNNCQPLCRSCHIEKSKTDLWDRRLNIGGGANQYGSY